MRWPGLAVRKQWVVAHPLAMGFVWGAVTVLLMALYEATFGGQPVDERWAVTHLIIFAVVSPAWGYLTRWAILRGQHDAR